MRAIFAFGIFFFTTTAFANDEWIYANIANPKAPQITLSTTGIGGHLRVPTTICRTDEEFICFYAKGFNFALPRSSSLMSEWRFKGVTFVVRGKQSLAIIGQPVDVVWVEQKTGRNPMRFLYSEVRGLVAFQLLAKGSPMYLLEGACGFAASVACQPLPLASRSESRP